MTASGPDPRRHPWRGDLAAAHLRGRVPARAFVEGAPHRVRAGCASLRGTPDPAASPTSQLLYGEGFTVYDTRNGWAWGQNATDDYVGWVRDKALAPGAPTPATHVVTALRSFVFPEPDLKTPPLDALPLSARVTAVDEHGGYLRLADGGWVFAGHLAPPDWHEPDLLRTALRLTGVPYLWGGRSPWGIDCSGLAQLSLRCAGIACPRDSDMQRDEVGQAIDLDTLGRGTEAGSGTDAGWRRGDLVFFAGHVGLMVDGARLLHATAFTMTVVVESLADVAGRAGGIVAARRLAPSCG
jgi:cell wall-associated NlpC family hydrolase